jgi:hypothetical protein
MPARSLILARILRAVTNHAAVSPGGTGPHDLLLEQDLPWSIIVWVETFLVGCT